MTPRSRTGWPLLFWIWVPTTFSGSGMAASGGFPSALAASLAMKETMITAPTMHIARITETPTVWTPAVRTAGPGRTRIHLSSRKQLSQARGRLLRSRSQEWGSAIQNQTAVLEVFAVMTQFRK